MFKPILDRVLLRKIEEKQDGKVIIPDQFHESSKYEIVALGDFAMFGGVRVPLSDIVEVGERVLVGHYNIEPCEIDGEKLFLTRVQDIRGREHVHSASLSDSYNVPTRIPDGTYSSHS